LAGDPAIAIRPDGTVYYAAIVFSRDGAFIGDYSQAAVGADGVVHTAWTDFRGRPGVTSANQDVYRRELRPVTS
jgi:hypothetical protein